MANTDSLTLTTDDAGEIAYGESFDGYTFVTKQEVSKHRWYTKRLVVFEHEGRGLRGFYYLEPATEMQDGQDRFESDPVNVFPVRARKVVTLVYEASS